MEAKTVDAASRLTIHIAGDHETNASIGLTIIPLLKIPTAIIEFRHPTGARVWWEGWCEAAEMLDRVFPEQVDAGELREPELTINSFVILDGAPRRAKVRARSAAVSPDGIGALSVTVGGLTIACASRNAVECQVRGWREAYDMFARNGGFGLPSADEVAARVRANHDRHEVKLFTTATGSSCPRPPRSSGQAGRSDAPRVGRPAVEPPSRSHNQQKGDTMMATGPISQGQRVRIERRPTRSLAASGPEVWEGTVLQMFYVDNELTGVEIYGRRESTGETKRVMFSLTPNQFFRTTVTLVES
ncbi:hypothetical protein ACFVYE_37195 [Streptomyces sp. NPDC058239]|uniref:hypothetical protein n=1 Tax=Streptomyces sp. NPDC058239 TaxID=3346395 RepID=UPI0036EBA93F